MKSLAARLTELPLVEVLGRVEQLEILITLLVEKMEQQEREIAELRDVKKRDDSGVYSEKQMARMLQVQVRTLQNWRNAGVISFIKTTGGRVRYTQQHYEDFLKSRERNSDSRAA